MNYRRIGKSGLKVSEIAIGSWLADLSNQSKLDAATDVIKTAYEQGINFFDCADAYGNGASEQFLGAVLKDYRRSDLVVSSKVYFPTGDGVNDRGLSRKHIMENCERSLKNMQMDYLDLYYCHRFDEETDLEETLTAMSDLVRQGKVLYYGVSEEWSGTRLMQAQKIIEQKGLYPITVLQPQYNLFDRYIEHDIMEVCEENGYGITSFSPLAQGLLTGKYQKGVPAPAGSRATWQSDHQINDLMTDENFNKLAQLKEIAKELDLELSVMAIAWLLRKEVVASVITGASRPEQLLKNVAASGVVIPQGQLKAIDELLGFEKFERRVG